MLRDIDPAPRLFWKPSQVEQVTQTVTDQNADYEERKLSANEVAALALNEVAAHHRSGFFFHLPSRYAWTTTAVETRLPAERRPGPVGHQYMNLCFMKYRWTANTASSFSNDGHRARFLRSSAILSCPQAGTPLFAIQHAIQKYPVFVTDPPTLVLYATTRGYYLASTKDLLDVLGRDPKDTTKIGSANWLWDRASLDKGKDDRRSKDEQMSRFLFDSLEKVYFAILQRCQTMSDSLDATTLRRIIPRPQSSTNTVGPPLGGGLSANPPTRRGERHAFGDRKRKRSTIADVQDE